MSENSGEYSTYAVNESPAEAKALGKESVESREVVLSTFNKVLGMMKDEPQDNLSPEDRAAVRLIEDVKKKTLDIGQDTYKNIFPGPNNAGQLTLEEGVPVEGLLAFLDRKIHSQPALSTQTINEYKGYFKSLHSNSRRYDEATSGLDPFRLVGRVRQEAGLISQDPDRDKGSDTANFLQAHKDLTMHRRELVLPPKEGDSQIESESLQPAPNSPDAKAGAEDAGNMEKSVRGEQGVRTAESGQDLSPEQIEINIVNRSAEIRGRARDIVEKMFRYKMREGSKWNPGTWMRRIGLHMFEEGYKQKHLERVVKAMIANNNSALEWDFAKNELKDANARRADEKASGQAAIARVKEGNIIAGEDKRELQGALRDAVMNEIIKPIINGDSGTDEKWVQDKLREFVKNNADNADVKAVFGNDATQYGIIADYFATDILELGKQIREDISTNNYSLEQFDKSAQINLANTRWAAETDAKFKNVDKFIAWTQKSKWGHVFTPAVIGALASVWTFALIRAPGSALRLADFAAPLVGSLVGGGIAAVRRYSEEKKDRAAHQRERAYGDEIPDGGEAKKREILEGYQYDVASVDELKNGGGKDTITVKDIAVDRKSVGDLLKNYENDKRDENRQAISSRIAEITARLDFSALNKVDLVRFEGEFKTEQGRLELLRTVCELKLALKKAGVTREDLDKEVDGFSKSWNEHFTRNTQQKDREFKRYRIRQSMKSLGWGMLIGGSTSLVTQEALAGVSRGLGIEAGSGPTIVEKGLGLDWAPEPKGAGAAMVIEELTKNGKADFGNLSAHMDSGGKVIIDSIGGKAYTGASPEITIDPISKTLHIIGDLTDPKFNNLDDEFKTAGFGVSIDTTGSGIARPIDARDFLANVRGTVHHTEWYGNNTRPSDYNELSLHNLKTDNGQGVIFSMSKMGIESYQAGNNPTSVDVPQFIKEGKGVFSFWRPGDLNHPILIKADANGLLSLDKSAPATEMVEVNVGGKWIKMPESSVANLVLGRLDDFTHDSDFTNHSEALNFKCSAGGLFEKNGNTHFGAFATIKGTGEMPEVIPGMEPEIKTILTPPEPPADIGTAPPIAIPEAPRKIMEDLVKKKAEDKPAFKQGEPIGSPQDAERKMPPQALVDPVSPMQTDQYSNPENQLSDQRPQFERLTDQRPKLDLLTDQSLQPAGLLTDQRPVEVKPPEQPVGPDIKQDGGSSRMEGLTFQDFIESGRGKLGNIAVHIEKDGLLKVDKIDEQDYTGNQMEIAIDRANRTLRVKGFLRVPPFDQLDIIFKNAGYRVIEVFPQHN